MRGALVFNLFLLTIPAYFVWSAFSYPPQARYIPLLIGVGVLVLQIWVILGERFPSLARVFDTSLLDLGRGHNPAPSLLAEASSPSPSQEGWRVSVVVIWMGLFFILLYLLGSFIATFTFIFLFLVISGKTPWSVALGVSAGTALMLWGLFVVMMRYQLFEGLLFGGLIPPF